MCIRDRKIQYVSTFFPAWPGFSSCLYNRTPSPVHHRGQYHLQNKMLPLTTRFQAKLDTRFGLVGVRTEGAALAEIVYLPRSAGTLTPSNALAERACAQIEKYVADPEFRFKLPLKEVGTAFQRRVWNMIASIPRGQTRTYGDIARVLRSGPRAMSP